MKNNHSFIRACIAISVVSTTLFNSCINSDFDLQKVKTDNLTLFGDSLIVPLGNTKNILMDEIITDEVLKDLGMEKDEDTYRFDFKSKEDINLDFSIKDDITFAAPTLPADQTIDTGFGSFSLSDININTSVSATVADGQVVVTGQGTNLDDYEYSYTSNISSARKRQTPLTRSGIGRSFDLTSNAINIDVAAGTTKASHSNELPSGIPIKKFLSFQINNATGGTLKISLKNDLSAPAIKALGCDYSNVRAIFPKELIVSGTGISLDPATGQQSKNFSTNGVLSVTLSKIDYGENGLVPAESGATEMSFEFGYDGMILVSRPQDLTTLADLQSNSTVKLEMSGALSSCSITAVTAETKERSESLTIDDTKIELGSTDVPSMVKSLSSLWVTPVKINVAVGKLAISEPLSAQLPKIGGELLLELPDFCRIEGQTIGTDGKWKYSFADLSKNGFTIPLLIDRIANIPAIQNGQITFPTKWIKISGAVKVPSFKITDISTVTSQPIQLSTKFASGITNGKIMLEKIEGAVENNGSYKIELAMLKDLREGTGDQKIKLENIDFLNPNFLLNFKHTLPTDFKTLMTLTPYIANEVKGTPVDLETTLKGGGEQTTIVDNITDEQVNGLISQLPDSIVLSYTVRGGSPTAPATMKISDMKSITFGARYDVGLPLSFGPDMKISTSGTADLSLGKEFADMLFGSEKSKIVLMVTTENSIPLNLSIQINALDKDGNKIEGVVISPFVVGGGTIENDVPIPNISKFNIEMKGSKEAVASVTKLSYEVSAAASEAKGATVRSDCSLKMSMTLKLLGGINISL